MADGPAALSLCLDHLHFSEFSSIYEPAEDTYLLCDALTDTFLHSTSGPASTPGLVVEIGPGSGAVSAHLGNLFTARGLARPVTLCIDVSPVACAATLRTARANAAVRSESSADGVAPDRTDAVTGDLLSCCLPRLAGRVDILLFNPPYVPTRDAEVPSARADFAARPAAEMLPAAWAGGRRGRRVLDRALPQLAACLAPGGGTAFVVLVEDNVPSEVARAAEALGLRSTIVRRTTARNERLLVMRLDRP